MLGRAARAAVLLLWAFGVAVVVISTVPDHPLRMKPRSRLALRAFVPQGWAFFTRDPQEPILRLFHPRDGRWVRADFTNSGMRNWFGLKKDTRPMGIEIAHLLQQVPRSAWRECEGGTVAHCLSRGSGAPVAVENGSMTHRFCGAFAVDSRHPVPWAWSRRVSPDRMPSRQVVLEVRC